MLPDDGGQHIIRFLVDGRIFRGRQLLGGFSSLKHTSAGSQKDYAQQLRRFSFKADGKWQGKTGRSRPHPLYSFDILVDDEKTLIQEIIDSAESWLLTQDGKI